MALRLGFDIDGVLADFRNAFDALSRKQGEIPRADAGLEGWQPGSAIESPPRRPDPEDVATEPLTSADIGRIWKEIARTKNWWSAVEAYEPSEIGRLYRLARAHRWEVFFLTRRPESAGDTVQLQTQCWLESNGFYLPSVLTVLGSRGELASALRLDIVVDDTLHNLVDVIGASTAKAMLLSRDPAQAAIEEHATSRGIGVVHSLREAIDVLERLEGILSRKQGPVSRLANWFFARRAEPVLPANPREAHPLPKEDFDE
jgi:hypothetical protein